MTERPQAQADARIRRAQDALRQVALRLAASHGRHQFYALGPVLSASAALDVDTALAPWVLAALVGRPDFEAYYALRDVPATYARLRADLTAAAPAPAPMRRVGDDLGDSLESVLDWLDLAAEGGMGSILGG